jgi:hypothetical protein
MAAGVYLSEPPIPSPLLRTVWIQVPLYLFTQGRGWGGEVDEPVRRFEGCYFTRGVENANMKTVSPVFKLYWTPVKTIFRVWCLYRYLVDVSDPDLVRGDSWEYRRLYRYLVHVSDPDLVRGDSWEYRRHLGFGVFIDIWSMSQIQILCGATGGSTDDI